MEANFLALYCALKKHFTKSTLRIQNAISSKKSFIRSLAMLVIPLKHFLKYKYSVYLTMENQRLKSILCIKNAEPNLAQISK